MSVEKVITATIKLNEKSSPTSEKLQQLKQMIQNQRDAAFSNIKGNNGAIQHIIHTMNKVAKTDATILITGENRVGKELFAQAIHDASLRNKTVFLLIAVLFLLLYLKVSYSVMNQEHILALEI